MWRRDQNVEIRREKEEKGKKQNSKLGIKYLKSFINIEQKKKKRNGQLKNFEKHWDMEEREKALCDELTRILFLQ